jgi:peroxiredoxin
MASTASTMLPLGTAAPAFRLPNVATGQATSLEDFSGPPALLVIFLCAHCPYVHHVAPELARLANDFDPQALAIVGITANDIEGYPQDAPAPTAKWAKEHHLTFPILFDETQDVAKAYTAACTPDFFLFGPDRRLVYRGQIDDSRPSRGSSDGRDLRAAVQAVIAAQPVSEAQKPSIGCNIKWKPGNAPDYFARPA